MAKIRNLTDSLKKQGIRIRLALDGFWNLYLVNDGTVWHEGGMGSPIGAADQLSGLLSSMAARSLR
jgi:hypothetical protein